MFIILKKENQWNIFKYLTKLFWIEPFDQMVALLIYKSLFLLMEIQKSSIVWSDFTFYINVCQGFESEFHIYSKNVGFSITQLYPEIPILFKRNVNFNYPSSRDGPYLIICLSNSELYTRHGEFCYKLIILNFKNMNTGMVTDTELMFVNEKNTERLSSPFY